MQIPCVQSSINEGITEAASSEREVFRLKKKA